MIADETPARGGPLQGMRVIEVDARGPVTFAAMMLADHGADVVRVVRPGTERREIASPLRRNRPLVALDLKAAVDRAAFLGMVAAADVLIEGNRPGVMERLALGPTECHAVRPELVYSRVTGWGQDGPYRGSAGHDINYIATTGALLSCGGGAIPQPPLNLLADFGGGGMLAAFSTLAAWVEARTTGVGRVLDIAMTDGVNLINSITWGLRSRGRWDDQAPGTNQFDGGAPHYRVYATSDDRYLAVGSIEPQFRHVFYATVLDDPDAAAASHDPATWPGLRERVTAAIGARPLDEWLDAFAGTDACINVVNSMTEALEDPHLVARASFATVDGVVHPRPAPAFGPAGHIERPTLVTPAEVMARWTAP